MMSKKSALRRFGFKAASWGGGALGVCLLAVWLVWSRGEWMAKRLMVGAEVKWQQDDYLGAIWEYEKVIGNYPKTAMVPEAYYWKGVGSFLFLDDPEAAVTALKKVTQIEAERGVFKHSLLARQYLAEIYEKKLNRPTEAIAVYEGVIENSQDAEQMLQSRYKIGEIYFAMGDMAQARVEWDLLVESGPKSRWAPIALYRKGGTYFVTGACEEAVEIYKALYTAYPEDQMSHFAKFRAANCLEMEEQPSDALMLYQELEENYPDPGLIKQKMETLNQRIQAS